MYPSLHIGSMPLLHNCPTLEGEQTPHRNARPGDPAASNLSPLRIPLCTTGHPPLPNPGYESAVHVACNECALTANQVQRQWQPSGELLSCTTKNMVLASTGICSSSGFSMHNTRGTAGRLAHAKCQGGQKTNSELFFPSQCNVAALCKRTDQTGLSARGFSSHCVALSGVQWLQGVA